MVTSFRRRTSSAEVAARPCTPLSTKSKKCRNLAATHSAPRSDGRQGRADSAIEVNRKAFQQNQILSYNEGQSSCESGLRPSSSDGNSIISFRKALQDDATPRRPDTPAHFAFPQIGSPCSTSSSQSKREQHDRTSKDTDMLPPKQLHGYEDCVSANPYRDHYPMHKSALTRIIPSRHQVHITKPNAKRPSSQQAHLLSPEHGKLVDDLEASTKELSEAKDRLSKAEKEILTLKQQLTDQDRRVYKLNADIANKREGMSKTAELCTSISSELHDLKSTQGKSPLSLARHQRKVNENLKLDNRGLTKKLKQALSDLCEMELRWKRAQSRASEAYSHFRTCAEECRDLKAFVRSQDKRIEEQDEAHEVMARESALKQAESVEAKAAMKHLRSVQAELNDTKASLRNVKAANKQVIAERDAAEDEIGRVEQRNQNLLQKWRSSDVVGLQDEIDRYRRSLEATEQNNRQLAKEVNSLRKRLSGSSYDSGIVVSPRPF